MKYSRLLMTCVLASTCAFSPAALADKGKGHHGKYKKHHVERHHHRGGHDDSVVIGFAPQQRVIVQEYYRDNFHPCPPGLAKKNPYCMPPGQYRRHYTVGQVLPSYVEVYEVPRSLRARLAPVPYGYQYVMVDRDVLLISEASKKVIDAITLLSAVN